MKTRFQVFLGLFALVLLVGAGCAANAPADEMNDTAMADKDMTEEKGPVRIGWVGPLTGDAASLGKDARIASEIAAEEINANGGINGRMIELVFEDGKCNPKDASNAGNKLIAVDGIRLINGAACSAETSAIAPIAEENRAVLLSYCSSAPPISQAGDYIFRSYPSDAFQGVFAANYAYEDLGARYVAVIAALDDWGQGIKKTFVKQFESLGGTVVYTADHTKESADLRTDWTKIKASDAELVFFPAFTKTTIAGLRQAQEIGLDLQFLGADAWDDTTIHESGVADDIFYTVPKADVSDEWRNKMETRGANVTACAPRAYDNIYLLADVVGRVGDDPTAVKDALYEVENFQGVAGPITLDENGDPTTAAYNVKTVKNKQTQIVK